MLCSQRHIEKNDNIKKYSKHVVLNKILFIAYFQKENAKPLPKEQKFMNNFDKYALIIIWCDTQKSSSNFSC